MQVETSPNPYYGRFQTLAQLSLAYPTGELNAFAIIDAGAGVTPQVAAWDDVEEIWEISGAVDTVVQAASLSAFPVTGNSNTLYVALDSFKPYIWYNSSYWSLVPDAQATFNVFLVRDVASSIPDVSTNGLIYIKTDGSTGLTHILFPVNYSSYLNDLKTLVDGGRSMYLKIYNHTKRGFHLIAVDSLDFADVDDTCHLVDIATGLTTAQIEPEDTVQVFIDTDNEGTGGGTDIPPVDETYTNITALIADQNSQLDDYYYLVTDASDDPELSSGKAIYLYQGTTVGDLSDYIRVWAENEPLPSEEDIQGNVYENTTATGAINVSANDYSAMVLTLTGNTSITITDTPASGKTKAMSGMVQSNTTETFAITNATRTVGEFVADGTINTFTIDMIYGPSTGLEIIVTYNQVN